MVVVFPIAAVRLQAAAILHRPIRQEVPVVPEVLIPAAVVHRHHLIAAVVASLALLLPAVLMAVEAVVVEIAAVVEAVVAVRVDNHLAYTQIIKHL